MLESRDLTKVVVFPVYLRGLSASVSQTPCGERARGGCASALVHSVTRRKESAALPAAASQVPGRPLGPTRWWPGGREQEALRLGGVRAQTPVFGSSPPTTECGRGRRRVMHLQNQEGVVGKQNTGSQKQDRSAAKNRSHLTYLDTHWTPAFHRDWELVKGKLVFLSLQSRTLPSLGPGDSNNVCWVECLLMGVFCTDDVMWVIHDICKI